MKRNDAFRKLHTVCTRLDAVNPEDFFVVPLRLYLYGSLLTNKPNPSDVDLLFQYAERKDLDPMKMLSDLMARNPLPHNKALTYLRKGMKNIRIELLSREHTLANWRQLHAFEAETPIQLIWEPGLHWRSILQELEDYPTEWQPALEAYYKARQAKLKQISVEQGEEVAEAWFRQAGERAEENAPGSKDKETLED